MKTRQPTLRISMLVAVCLMAMSCSKSEQKSAAQRATGTSAVSAAEPPPAAGTETLLAARSPKCRACARQKCMPPKVMWCEDPSLVAQADGGAAKGTPKNALCLETLGCVLKAGCAAKGPQHCYCGPGGEDPFECLAGKADGVCRSVQERGLETTEPKVIAVHYSDKNLGAGVANALVQCLIDDCAVACIR